MLPIGIKRDNVARAMLQREFDAGLQRGALTQVHRVGRHRCSGSKGGLPCCVLRAVINHQHVR